MACSADERYLIHLELDDDFPLETLASDNPRTLEFAMYSFV